MKQFDYMKSTGSFTDAASMISLPSDSELFEDVSEKIEQEKTRITERINADTEIPAGEKEAKLAEIFAEMCSPDPDKEGNMLVQLRYAMTILRGRAGVQTQTSIYDKEILEKFRKLFKRYGINEVRSFNHLVFEGLNWTAKGRQKPKVQLFCKDDSGELCNIRFEAANELAQKILRAVEESKLQPGQIFSLNFEAQNPVDIHNQRIAQLESLKEAGVITEDQASRLDYMKKHPKKEGTVDHVLTMTSKKDGKSFESLGRPPKGEKFQQKMTLEEMEALYKRVQRGIDYKSRVDDQPVREIPNV